MTREPQPPGPFDIQATYAMFRALRRRGMTYGAAGVWLDTFSMRLGNVHSARWNAEHPALCAQHDQQAGQLSHLLRRMTRLLQRLDVDHCCSRTRGKMPPTGQLALREIACQAGALIATLRESGHACHDEAFSALKDALLDEGEELLGEWIKTTNRFPAA